MIPTPSPPIVGGEVKESPRTWGFRGFVKQLF